MKRLRGQSVSPTSTAPTDCIHQQVRRQDLTPLRNSSSCKCFHGQISIRGGEKLDEKTLGRYVYSSSLGTIFHKLNRHQEVKNFDVYKYVNLFNLLQVSSYSFLFKTMALLDIFYLFSDDLN
jgi:hypothetical protein